MRFSFAGPMPTLNHGYMAISLCHSFARLRAALAGFLALAHAVQARAAFRACPAYFRAGRADSAVLLNADQHRVRSRAANLGAREHQAKMPWLDMSAACFQTMLRGCLKTAPIAVQATARARLDILVICWHLVLLAIRSRGLFQQAPFPSSQSPCFTHMAAR